MTKAATASRPFNDLGVKGSLALLLVVVSIVGMFVSSALQSTPALGISAGVGAVSLQLAQDAGWKSVVAGILTVAVAIAVFLYAQSATPDPWMFYLLTVVAIVALLLRMFDIRAKARAQG